MQLRVENLGPIREAEVDLSQDLIVLTGPNNMGKTWFAWTVYALMRGARSAVVSVPMESQLTPDRRMVTIDSGAYSPLLLDLVESTASKVTRELSDVFASARSFFTDTRLRWEVPARNSKGMASQNASPWASITAHRPSESVHAAWYADPAVMQFELQRTLPEANVKAAPQAQETITETQASTLTWLCRTALGLSIDTVLFPAERLAVNLFARELAASRAELVEEALVAEERGQDPSTVIRRAGRFPLPIRDSLSTATRLDSLARHESSHADLAVHLERSLLGGSVRANDRGELHFAPHASNISLPVHMSASIVKSLASLAFYFRHLAVEGAFLIIDEPELNLHPDAQRKVARFLGKVINRGFKVMISTHSDFVVRELSHLVMLGSAGEAGLAVASELGYDADSLLTPDKVGAWLFNEGTATRIPVDGTGFGVRTIDDEISRMNADSQRIYARLVG